MSQGTVFDVKRFAVHDGSGIRTTLFVKGCPLRCPWCQNPEGLDSRPLLWTSATDCVQCGTCAATCPNSALHIEDGRVRVNREACRTCGACCEACPTGSLSILGRRMEAGEAADILMRDEAFFGKDGGVTISGGEVLSQWRFAAEVLGLCRDRGTRTAVETSMHGPREAMEALLPVVDEFLVDIKYADSDEHNRVIGVGNEQILSNYRFLVEKGANVLVRTPIIPGYTATEENIRAIARIVKDTQPDGAMELLAFNPLCRSKYSLLERDYPVEGGVTSREDMDRFRDILREEQIARIIEE